MRKWGFIGPTYTLSSLNAGAERCINLYPEVNEQTRDVSLVGTPGLRRLVGLPNGGPIRAEFAHGAYLYVVSGGVFYRINHKLVAEEMGTVRQDRRRAFICTNGDGGNQILVVSGGLGYIYNLSTEALTAIADPDFPADVVAAGFLEGYFIVLANNNRFYTSALYDGTLWDALDVNQRSTASDPWRTFIVSHAQIYFLGTKTSDLYYNSGDIDTPLIPAAGSLMDAGIGALDSAVTIDNSVIWVQADERGGAMVVRAQGYTPVRVSNQSVEHFLAQSQVIDKATAFAYQQEGHTFYVLSVPDLETSWALDIGTGMWHERAHWNLDKMRYEPHRGGCHAFAFGKNVVGDRLTGGIYELALDQYEDELVDRVGWRPTRATFSATGGVVTEANGYTIHTFASTDNFVVLEGEADVECFLIGGGAGGGGDDLNSSGGGAGAGGEKVQATARLSAGTYPVVVGAKGVGGSTHGTNGGNTTFNGNTANGGSAGGGGGTDGNSGRLGGGGGASDGTNVGDGGTGTLHAGGDGASNGGGGGAGAAGAGSDSPGGNVGGAGGPGVASDFDGTMQDYAGGGSGAGYSAPGATTHGGGVGATLASTGGNATRPGAGGGGGRFGIGGDGRPGVAMVRYPTP